MKTEFKEKILEVILQIEADYNLEDGQSFTIQNEEVEFENMTASIDGYITRHEYGFIPETWENPAECNVDIVADLTCKVWDEDGYEVELVVIQETI